MTATSGPTSNEMTKAADDSKLMLVDGHALVHRAFHALPELTTTSGELTNAVFGWASMVIKAIADLHPTHAIVAFDCATPTFRHERYAGYKATRARTPRPLALQFDRVRQVASAFHMPIVESPGYEADDVLGTLAQQAEKIGVPTVIVTGDLDTLQLVDENITVLTSKRQLSETILYDISGVKDRFGITPLQLPDLKGLIGDTSDNIPGIRGIGEKTASKLLVEYGSLEAIYEHLDEIPGKQQELLRTGRDQAFESRELARIVAAPVQLDLESASIDDFDMTEIVSLFRELEFRSLISRVQELCSGDAMPPMTKLGQGQDREQLSLFGQTSSDTGPQTPGSTDVDAVSPTAVEIVNTEERLSKLVSLLESHDKWVVSVETGGGHMVDADLVGLSFALEEGSAFYVPMGHTSGPQLEAFHVIERLAPPFENPEIKKLGHDLKQVHLVLGSHGVRVEGLYTDVILGSYLESASGRLLNLDSLGAQLLDIEIMTREQLAGKGKKQVVPRELGIDELGGYAGMIADVTLRLAPIIRERLTHRGLLDLFDNIEMPLVTVLSDMERTGVALDCDLLAAMSSELAATLRETEERIYERVGHPFNINSPPQLGIVLFEELNFPKKRRTKTGYSTDNEVLEKVRGHDPIVGDILEYRQLMKLKGTYIDALPALISARDGRLHTEFNQAVAATGRLSSSNPNLQNVPIRTDIGHKIRRAFTPSDPGKVLLAADYSQIELRVLAHLSHDPRLSQAFLNGEDIHVVSAAAVWGVDPSKVTSDQRRIAKVVNFGIAYGIGEQRLAYETGLSRDEARAFIETYRKTYAGVTDFMENTRSQAQLYGQVSTLLGRVRNLPEIHSNHPGIRQAAERAAINMPVQGTAADIIKLAMIRIANAIRGRGLNSRMILQVHDELVFEVPREEVDEMAALVYDCMSMAVELLVPLAVDVNIGENWGELRRYAGPEKVPA